jgi:hypothetical protein
LEIALWDLPAQLNCLMGLRGRINIVIILNTMVTQIVELFNRVNNLVLEIGNFKLSDF